MWVAFAHAKATHIFSAKILVYNHSFNDTLTNDIVSVEQLGPDVCITKTCLYNFDPLEPRFYIVKLGFTRVNIIFFLFLLKNIDCGYSLEPPLQGGTYEYPQSMFRAEIWKNISFFPELFHFLVVKNQYI